MHSTALPPLRRLHLTPPRRPRTEDTAARGGVHVMSTPAPPIPRPEKNWPPPVTLRILRQVLPLGDGDGRPGRRLRRNPPAVGPRPGRRRRRPGPAVRPPPRAAGDLRPQPLRPAPQGPGRPVRRGPGGAVGGAPPAGRLFAAAADAVSPVAAQDRLRAPADAAAAAPRRRP